MNRLFYQRQRRAIVLIGAVLLILLVYRVLGQQSTVNQPTRWCTGVACTDEGSVIFRSWSDGTVESYARGGLFSKDGWSALP